MSASPFPHLSKAPATEAVIEVRVKPRSEADIDDLRGVSIQGYSVDELREYSSEVQVGSTGPPVIRHEDKPSGFRFVSADGRVIVTAAQDRIATSRLAPYTRWEDLVSTAKEFCTRYMRIARPETIVRLGVRYINRLDLPVGAADLTRYLAVPPEPFPGADGQLTGFVKRVVTSGREGVATIVTQAVQEVYDARTVLIFDIDCALQKPFDVSDSSVWREFSQLRARKNTIFFGNLTQEGQDYYR